MLVNFIGCPSSGKTTIAAKVFANLKEAGFPAEFVAEYARFYIAKKRKVTGEVVTLTDDDQLKIMYGHGETERVMKSSSKETTVISDSSTLLSLVYMTPEFRTTSGEVRRLAEQVTSEIDVAFYCPPVQFSGVPDANRLHSYEEALEIDKKLLPLVKKFAPNVEVILLNGNVEEKVDAVLKHLYSKIGVW